MWTFAEFCAALPATDRETEILTHVLPSVEEISKDPSAHVKTALALNVMGLAPLLGSELTVEHLLPIFLTLLQDEVTEVRLNVISTFDKVFHFFAEFILLHKFSLNICCEQDIRQVLFCLSIDGEVRMRYRWHL